VADQEATQELAVAVAPLQVIQAPVVVALAPQVDFPGQAVAVARLQVTQVPAVVALAPQVDFPEPAVPQVDFPEPAVAAPLAASNRKSDLPPAVLAVDSPVAQVASVVLQASAVPEQRPLANRKSSASSFQPTPSDWLPASPTWGQETPPI
jgi:hypothetical protein